ncbi:unnamed protein product [Sympodiomycopsis kandeliae]
MSSLRPSDRQALHSQSTSVPARPRKQFSRSQLAERIAQGETLVLRERTIYKLDSWLSRHPGGELAILHFVGRDASDEIEVYHSEEILRRMAAFAIGTLAEEDWLGAQRPDGQYEGYRPLVPPIQLGYRNGRLEDPVACDNALLRQKQEFAFEKPAAAQGGLVTDSESDSGYSRGSSDNDEIEKPPTLPIPTQLLEPPVDPKEIDAVQERARSAAFKKLHAEVKHAGLYTLRPLGYLREVMRYLFLVFGSFYFWYSAQGSAMSLCLSSVFLGLFWHQITFSAHDAGHSGITHNHSVDRSIGIVIADLIGGLSIGWWCDNHDVHHLVTNHPEHDPDIQHMPFFAISPRFLVGSTAGTGIGCSAGKQKSLGLWSSYYRRTLAFDSAARVFLRLQHRIYYVVMSLGRFNLYANSYGFLLLKARRDKWFYIEMVSLAIFWTWFGALITSLPSWRMRAAYLLISHVVTSPLHIQIVLSHFAQSTEDLGFTESFASRQIRTTMDVHCSPSLDFLHGGLHMQVSHHLFPRLPRHNLRECRDRFVRPFAKRHGLKYEEYSFTAGNKRVLGVLQDVADQVKLLGKVAAAHARGEISH